MKKIIGVALSISMLISALPQTAVWAADNKCGDNLTWNISNNGTLTINGTGDMYNYHPTKDTPWNYDCVSGDVKSIVISDGVESISTYAFQNSTGLKDVTISKTVKNIGANPFGACEKLNKITVNSQNPNYCSVDDVLFNNSKTELITYPIGKEVNTYKIPDSVTTIKTESFDSAKLTSIEIPKSVTKIEEYAFYAANDITDIYYGGTAEDWNKINFDKASNFGISSNNEKLTMHYSSESSEVKVTGITLSETEHTVELKNGICCFLYANVLPSNATNKKVVWSSDNEDVVRVDNHGTCYPLSVGTARITAKTEDGGKTAECVFTVIEREIEPANGTLGDNLTWNLDSKGTLTISGNGDMTDKFDFNAPWSARKDDINSIVISDGVERVSNTIFFDSPALTKVWISKTVKGIYSNCFSYSRYLSKIEIDSDNPYYCVKNGVLYDKDMETLLTYPVGSSDESFIIPNGVITIAGSAFCKNNLKSITIPKTVEKILYAFDNDENLTITDVYYEGTEDEWNKIDNDAYDNQEISREYNKKLTIHFDNTSKYHAVESITFDNTKLFLTEGDSSNIKVTFKPSNASNKNITWTSDNIDVATVSDGTVTAIGEGSAVITAVTEDCNKTAKCTVIVKKSERAENKCGNNLYWTLKEAGPSYSSEKRYILNINGYGDMWDFDDENPAPWKKYITDLANHGSYVEKAYTDVYMNEGITSIGKNAFEYIGLITLPKSIRKIGDSNFIDSGIVYYNGTKEEYEKNVTVGQNVKFEYLHTYLNIDSTVSGSYGDDIKWTLTPDGILTISGNGEIPWHKLIGLYIDDNYDVFYEDAVKKIIVEEGITGINNFADFGYLTDVVLPESLTYIGNYCFSGDVNLKKITIPGSVTKIDIGALATNLDEIYFKSTISDWNKIEKYAPIENDIKVYYMQDNSLYQYEVNDGKAAITAVDKSISGDIIIPSTLGGYPVESILQEAFSDCNNITSIVVPDSVKKITDAMTFTNCKNLEKITLPGELEFEYATLMWTSSQFAGCDKLKEICISGDSTKYSVEDGVLFSKDGKTLIAYPPGKPDVSYTIPSHVEKIGIAAFIWCNNLRALIIPEGVVSIDSMSLLCSNLEFFTLPKSAVEFAGFQYWGDEQQVDVYYAGTEEEWYKIFSPSTSDRVHIHFNHTNKEITVTTDAQNGQADGGGKFMFGSLVTLTSAPDSGYRFAGWYIDDTLVSSESEYSFIAHDDVNVTAKFNKYSSGGSLSRGYTAKYTVTFVSNGGTDVEAVSVAKNTAVSKPADPTKDGFTFNGWYVDKELTNKYDFSTKLSADLTLYAGWISNDDAQNQIVLTIGKTDASVFGEKMTNDVAPLIRNDRTMLPARFVAENLGAAVKWNEESREVLITGKKTDGSDITIKIYIDSDSAYVNNEKITLDSPAFIENDRTYTPVRFIAEQLGARVEWNESEQKVIITKN